MTYDGTVVIRALGLRPGLALGQTGPPIEFFQESEFGYWPESGAGLKHALVMLLNDYASCVSFQNDFCFCAVG